MVRLFVTKPFKSMDVVLSCYHLKTISFTECLHSTTYSLGLNQKKFKFLWFFWEGGAPTNWSVEATNLPRDKCLHCLRWKTFILHQMHQDLVTHSMRKCSQAADGILVSRKTVTNMIDTQVFKTLNIPMENWLILLNYMTGTFNKVTKKPLFTIIIDNIFHELSQPCQGVIINWGHHRVSVVKKKAKSKEILPAISGLEESPVW